jgi:hypothetical protein
VIVGCLLPVLAAGALILCARKRDKDHKDVKEARDSREGEHRAVHGGCLNALGTCENGHAEVTVDGDTLKLWFVGGGADTDKAVRIPDREIALAVLLSEGKDPKNPDDDREAKALVLKAKPNELAEEKEGNCSAFEARADWLKGVKGFIATGKVMFKGKPQGIRIEWPKGYDPDDDADNAKDEKK